MTDEAENLKTANGQTSALTDGLGWISTQDKLHPDKPGLKPYEQVPCLVVYKREVFIRLWNCEHFVWDDEDGDDYFCSAEEITHWMLLPGLPPNAKLTGRDDDDN